MSIHSTYNVYGHLVFWDSHRGRVVDAIGPRVNKWVVEPKDFQVNAGTGTDPAGYTTTVVEVGAGTSEAEISDEAGIAVELITAPNENDGISLQHGTGPSFMTTTSNRLYFGIKLEASDATQSDFFVGLAVTNTNPLGGVTDGIYFEKLDGGTGISAVTEVGSAETQSDSLGTFANDTSVTLEFISDGTTVTFLINGSQVAAHTAGLPAATTGLRPTMQFLSGSAGAKRAKIHWARAFSIG